MLEDCAGDKRRAVAANADRGARQPGLCRLGEIDDLRDVGEVVARQRDDIRPPRVNQSKEGRMALDLQVDESDLMAPGAASRGDQLKT